MSEIMCIFAADFKGNHEALYLRPATENLRNFHVTQGSMMASRVLAWAVVYFSVTRYFLRTLSRRSGTQCHALLVIIMA